MKRRSFLQGGCGALVLLLAPTLAWAKVAVPYGEDNGPKDSATEAAADAFNDAIEGPDEGETIREWEVRLETAYEALHHEEADFEDLMPYGYGYDGSPWNTCELPAPSEDLCWSPVHHWLHLHPSDTMVDEAIESASVHADLMDALQPYVFHMMRILGAGGDVFVESPDITVSCNACSPTAAPLDVIVPFRLVSQQGIPGIPLGRGQVVAKADLFLQTSPITQHKEWCLSFRSHDIQGLNFMMLAAYEPRIDLMFESDPICVDWF